MATEGLHYPFADNFWGNEEASIQVIVERSRRSKQTSEQIKRLFEKRAQLEEEYGDRLLQIAQSPLGDHEEYGSTFSDTLNDIPAATEAAARAHLDLAQQIKHHLESPLSTFVKDQKEVRQATLSKIEEARQQKAFHISNATKAKDAYEAQCQHLIEMRQRLEDRSQQVGQEDIAKLQEQVAQTDQDYKNSIQALAAAYGLWYDEWREVCDIFQSLEERRLHYLRSSLWAYANMMSSVHTIDDQSCERIRTSLECMEVYKDLDTFVQKRRTGQTPPEPTKYENFFEKLKSSSKRSDMSSSVIKPLPPIAPPGSLWGNKVVDSEVKLNGEEAEPKSIREITIPVVDEELRSVDVQLKRLPTMRTMTAESLLAQTEAVVPSLPTNGLSKEPKHDLPRRHSKELVELDAVAQLSPPDDSNADHNAKAQSDDDSDIVGSVSDFIISRSSAPRGTANDLESSNIGSHRDDEASSINHNPTEAAESTQVPDKRSVTGSPSSPKSEKRTSGHGILSRPPPLAITEVKPTSTLMASPVSIKKPGPVVNTRNLNPTIDHSQPNSALSHATTETSGKMPSPPQPLANDHVTPRSPPTTTPSPLATSEPIHHHHHAKQPSHRQPIEPPTNQYIYASNDEDVDLGIRPPPWGVLDASQKNDPNQPANLASSYPENSPFLSRAAASMMTFDSPLPNHRSTPSPSKLDAPQSSKSPSLASKMKFAFNKSPGAGVPEKARTADTMPKPSKSETDSRAAARSATDPSAMPIHHVDRFKERSNSRFSLSIFKRDKEGKKHREKTKASGEQESMHAPSLLSNPISDNESGHVVNQQPSQAGSVPRSPGGSRGPDSALGLGPVSTTPEWASPKIPGSNAEPVHISQRMSSLGMEQLRQRQAGDSPPQPNWQATLADGTPILEYVQAQWSYQARIPDTEISFETNDVLAVITKQQDGWWEAEVLDQRRRRRGLVPSNFMKVLKSL
ncbi:hypothetical protein K450DRAFT_267531 [Umbelopsis ramanniana AG]|uniref:SH3 domain-containing protein n=1 Tax=Umbelopsis ramanniana AG TaxID=1314678 RepID=A0AAD5EIH2_UMBRA|nr:uncharacterized protein K450DRAFT_267531 [Umbelopsis ramanniana AG]KAI8584154.1 hypothetical protein K450DRAFT_267531 [Umbelopsis ramanniana AG]